MNLLLDTHIALWAIFNTARLPKAAREPIRNATSVWVSAVSLWEIALKHGQKPTALPVSPQIAHDQFLAAGYQILDVSARHAIAVHDLPWLHKDPFDRMLVAQAFNEPLTLLTRDADVAAYSRSIVLV
jgi:PIN domain nuclease of toxin-antitoxin system